MTSDAPQVLEHFFELSAKTAYRFVMQLPDDPKLRYRGIRDSRRAESHQGRSGKFVDHTSLSVIRLGGSVAFSAAHWTAFSSPQSPHLAVLRILMEVSDVMDRPPRNATRSPRLLCLADRG